MSEPMATRKLSDVSGASADDADDRPLLLITGMSGAGKTTALKALEDLGFETIDHLPLRLLPGIVQSLAEDRQKSSKPLAVGIGVRTRDFDVGALFEAVRRLKAEPALKASLIFLHCEDEELRRRYTATRHRHPLAEELPIGEGVSRERRILAPVRIAADMVIDTSGLAPGALKQMLAGNFSPGAHRSLVVNVVSFSFRSGVPRDADLVFDVRFLANPYYHSELRPLSGHDPAVGAYVTSDPDFAQFLDNLTRLLAPLLPRYRAEGKSYLTIAIGCTGGRHRSVYTAERLAIWLRDHVERVHTHHRDLDRSNR